MFLIIKDQKRKSLSRPVLSTTVSMLQKSITKNQQHAMAEHRRYVQHELERRCWESIPNVFSAWQAQLLLPRHSFIPWLHCSIAHTQVQQHSQSLLLYLKIYTSKEKGEGGVYILDVRLSRFCTYIWHLSTLESKMRKKQTNKCSNKRSNLCSSADFMACE